MKTFPIAQVLSITTGRLLCDMGGVYQILNHATGDDLFTHVLPRACRFAAPLIIGEYPELGHCGTDDALARLDVMLPDFKGWIAELREKHPELTESYEIPCWEDQWNQKDPLAEAVETCGEDKVVAVEIPVPESKIKSP